MRTWATANVFFPSAGMPWGYSLLLTLLVWSGFALRLPLLDRFPLREDEAIYAYWALHGWRVDPMFLTVWPDKPPLFLWALGLVFQLAGGPAPAVARWVSVAASTLTVVVLSAVARHWWGRTAGVFTALLAALNPFAISFAPTVYTDALLVLAGSLALTLAARNRAVWAGCWLAVAIMTKQQGLLFAPLVGLTLWLAWMNSAEHAARPRLFGVAARFLAGLGLVSLPILLWDSQRWAVAPSPWDLGARNVGSLTLAAPAIWGERLLGWWSLAGQLQASWLVWGVLGAAVFGALWLAHREPWQTLGPVLLLIAWGVAFFLIHLWTNVQIWDRYLLPLTMPLCLVGGWAGAVLWRTWARRVVIPRLRKALLAGAVLGCFCVALAVPAVQAAEGQLAVGGDHGDLAGLDQALAYVAQVAAGNGVLYHRELGWQARFYLFDAVRKGAVELRYFPSAVYLADQATKAPQRAKYLIAPDWAPVRDLANQLAARRLTANGVFRTGRFMVYRLAEIPAPNMAWRVCRPRPTAWPLLQTTGRLASNHPQRCPLSALPAPLSATMSR